MTIAIRSGVRRTTDGATVERLPGIAVAGIASIGAGAIHAGAIGIHAEHLGLARIFIAISLFQLGWGFVAVLRPHRWLAAIGAAGSLAVVAGWLATRLSGISFVGGLEQRETAQFADTACALLGMIAAGFAFAAATAGWRAARPVGFAVPSLAVLALTIPAMLSGADHVHDHGAAGAATEHGHDAAAGEDAATGESGPHDHGTGTPAAVATAGSIDESQPHDHPAETASPTDTTGESTGTGATADQVNAEVTETTAHDHEASASVAPVAYDPALPIDLAGVEGVTPEQQARAENLVAVTVVRLPQWSDPSVAEAAGFHSIGDAATGVEHYVQWDWINDDVWLDPDHPESLVYEPQPDGTKVLVSAMYMLPDTMTLDDVPDIGGSLTQWHIHNNLCYTLDPVAPRVAGLTDASGGCPPTLQKMGEAPMIHVWIRKHPCGPFAALEGIGAGQVLEGEEHLCDHAHGG